MPELLIFLIGAGILLVVGYAGFLGGRDAAERQAYATIAALRSDLSKARLESERLREHNRMLAQRIDRANVIVPEVPEWLR